MSITLTEEERARMEEIETADLLKTVAANERKRRRVNADKKAYAAACKDMTDMIEAQTEYALEVLEKREIAEGTAAAPGFAPIVSFPEEPKKTTKKVVTKKKASQAANPPPPQQAAA